MLRVNDEWSTLERVVIGRGVPYQRDLERVAAALSEYPQTPRTARSAAVASGSYPDEALLLREYADFAGALGRHGVEVLEADPDAAWSFDYTCPRDIGFVIGELFVEANMAVPSRREEIRTVEHHLEGQVSERVRPPPDALLEGGDVLLLGGLVLVGINRRSNEAGYRFLEGLLTPRGLKVLPVRHDRLHLDCCLNPLGAGHLLVHRPSLEVDAAALTETLSRFEWIEVDEQECEHLVTNVLSIAPDTVVVRSHPACERVNDLLARRGYHLEVVDFDGVPATGGSFRCASLPLRRRD